MLSGLDLHVKAGETVALVGESGSGKSTIVNFVTGFYLADSGKVTIDGIDIKDIDLKSYRKNIAVVPQNSILFSGTVRDNITYGSPNISQKQLPFVLLHEQTHIENRDAALKFAAAAALSINWFNPLVWVMVKYFLRDIERCCDEKVLASLKGEKASFYANTILDFAERESLSAPVKIFNVYATWMGTAAPAAAESPAFQAACLH